MIFSDTTNLNGIVQTIERLTDLGQTYFSGDTTRLKELTAMINVVNHKVWHTIFMATGNWQYDDGNYTDVPYATTDLVSGQKQYSIPSDSLTVQRVEIMDSGGNWIKLEPYAKESIGIALPEFNKANGIPNFYRLFNGVIELSPATDYNSTNGLKVYYDRDSIDFVYTDTTKTPGFASPYHNIIPIKTSIDWLKVKQPNSATLTLLMRDEQQTELAITSFYAKRFKDYIPKISRVKESYK